MALAGLLAGTVVVSDGDIIAMGRVVGDGGNFLYLSDVVVVPSRQGGGIGSLAGTAADLLAISANSEIQVAERSGHDIHIEEPGLVIDVIEDVVGR